MMYSTSYIRGEVIKVLHELKITPEYFSAVSSGEKNFEVRRDDRAYAVGDILKLKEYKGHSFTGNEVTVGISYILRDRNYCKEGFCILGIKPITEPDILRRYI